MSNRSLILKRVGILMLGIIAVCCVSVGVFWAFTEQLGSLVFALLIGAMGAAVSIARRIPSLSDAEAKAIEKSWWAIAVPCIVGIAMGGILYFLFLARILTGHPDGGLFTSNLFPTFTKITKTNDTAALLNLRDILSTRPENLQDFGKLLVWCFLAGFSERLVPSVLHGLEGKGVGGNAGEETSVNETTSD